jgi:hypothetical protein
MKKTKWWMLIVGVFYLAMTLMNVIGIGLDSDGSMVRDSTPFTIDDNGVHAFVDAWMTFIFALGALGLVLLFASTRPHRGGMLVLTIVMGELAFGVGGDIWLIARGYSAAAYVPFIAVHLVIITTGVMLLRGELKGSLARAT